MRQAFVLRGLTKVGVPVGAGGVRPRDVQRGDCFRVVFDLAKLTSWPPVASVQDLDPRSVLLQPLMDVELVGTVRVVPPVDGVVLVPWRATAPNAYRVEPSAFTLPAHLLLARSAVEHSVPLVGRAAIRTGILPGFTRLSNGAVSEWVQTAERAIASIFPNDSHSFDLFLVPVPPMPWASESAVLHGVASRGGGRHIVAYVRADSSDEELPGEWVLIHELLHHVLPWVADDWFSEGLASYYQEVVRSRAGILAPEAFWWELADGFARGAADGGRFPLAEESRKMMETRAFRRVYWAGAAIALLADVAIRESSRGTRSLDDGLRALARVEGSLGVGRAMEIIAEGAGDPAYSTLVRKALESKAFPDVDAVLNRLGVRFQEGRVTLDSSAPLASIRRAIETGGGAVRGD